MTHTNFKEARTAEHPFDKLRTRELGAPYKILISVGEESGDQRASTVIQALKKLAPSAQIKGMGGNAMRNAGVDTIIDSAKYGGLMGFKEVFLSLRKTLEALNTLKKTIDEWQPDLVIVVDYPDFNLRLAKYAFQKKVPVLYYIPPKVWAWRKGRIKLLRKYCTKIATIFPFETEFYQQNGCVQQHYVGHPFTYEIGKQALDRGSHEYQEKRKQFLESISLNPNAQTVAIFPGSRKHEIEKHMSVIAEVMGKLKDKIKDLQFVISAPSKSFKQSNLNNITDTDYIKIVSGESLEVLKYCDIGILKSGTCNLEAAFLNLPFTMFFKISDFTAAIAKYLIKLKEVSPVNLIKTGTIKEHLQDGFTVEAVFNESYKLLTDNSYREDIKKNLNDVVSRLSPEGSQTIETTSENVAMMAVGILK